MDGGLQDGFDIGDDLRPDRAVRLGRTDFAARGFWTFWWDEERLR